MRFRRPRGRSIFYMSLSVPAWPSRGAAIPRPPLSARVGPSSNHRPLDDFAMVQEYPTP